MRYEHGNGKTKSLHTNNTILSNHLHIINKTNIFASTNHRRFNIKYLNTNNMADNTNSQIQIIRDLEGLNREGCRFFVDANTANETIISSAILRWLTHGRSGDTFFTDEQGKAVDRITKAAEDPSINNLNIKLLLYENPMKAKGDVSHIKTLLQCGDGVKVRYLRRHKDQQLRIAQCGHKMYLSMSNSQRLKVDRGIVYTADSENDPLIDYFHDTFYNDFNRAKPLTYKNGKIRYADNFVSRAWTWIKSDRGIGIIGLIVGLIGLLIAFA